MTAATTGPTPEPAPEPESELDHDRASGQVVEPEPAATVDPLGRRLVTAGGAGLVALAALTIPNAVVDVGFFTRGVPVRWWELPVAAIAALLVATWFLIPTPRPARRNDTRPVVGATFVALFAVGCPTCNALMMLALGAAGAMRWWAPIQPYLALVCLAALVVAVAVRWRRRDCTGRACAAPASRRGGVADASPEL